MTSTHPSDPPPPVTTSNSEPPPPVVEGTAQAAVEPAAQPAAQPAVQPEAVTENRGGSVPPPPPRRRRDEAPAGLAAQSSELPPPQRPRSAEMPVIPRLDVPRIANDAGDGATSASTIPPAARVTAIRSPSEVLQSRSAPAITQAPTPSPWTSALTRAKQFGAAAHDRLPGFVRENIEGTSGGVLLGAGLFGALMLVSVGSAVYELAAGPSGSQAQPSAVASSNAPAESATPDAPPQLPAARAPAAADEKAAKSPSDEATVLLDLAESLLAQRRDADAVPPLERLIARQPELKDNERVGRVLLAAAASNDRQAASKSHALLTGPMGESGAALLYELSLKSEVREAVRQRARSWLSSKDFERVAPLPVYAAVRLRNASTCEDKHALLDFAGKVGGKHVLSYLKELEQKKFCAPDNLDHCYPCMRADTRLTDTIAKLDSR